MKRRILMVLLCMALTSGLICGCGGKTSDSSNSSDSGKEETESKNPGDPIKISTLAETEGTSIGKLMVCALIANGYEVEDNTGTAANINVMREAVINGEVDLIFDYDGDAYWYLDDDAQAPSLDDFRTPGKGWEIIKAYDVEKNNITWLNPSQANNTFAIAVTNQFADENNIDDLHDFADYVNNGGEVKLITPAYWLDDDSNLPAIEKTYGFTLDREKQCQIVDGLNERMVAEGVDGVNCGLVFADQGSLLALDMRTIKDPEHAELIYAFCPVIANGTLEKYPEIEEILKPIFESLTDEDVISLNSQIQIDGKSGDDVANEYLKEKGYIK